MSGIAPDVRKYFEEVKKMYEEGMMQPGEFTMTMFENETGLKDASAKAILDADIKSGKLTVRSGRNAGGIPCQLYKVVK